MEKIQEKKLKGFKSKESSFVRSQVLCFLMINPYFETKELLEFFPGEPPKNFSSIVSKVKKEIKEIKNVN